jgi:hypothetical protein
MRITRYVIGQDLNVRNPMDGETKRWYVQNNVNESPDCPEVVWRSGEVYDEQAERGHKRSDVGPSTSISAFLSRGVVARARVHSKSLSC